MGRKSIWIAGLAALALGLSLLPLRPLFAAGSVEMQVEHLTKVAIEEYNEAMDAGTPDNWVKYFTDNVTRNDLLSSQHGKGEFAEYYQQEFKNFRAKMVVNKMIVGGRSVAVVFTWDAVHKLSGRSLKLEMVGVFEMASNGKFDSVSFYYDSAKAGKFYQEVSTASK